jgi:hypothetical protein
MGRASGPSLAGHRSYRQYNKQPHWGKPSKGASMTSLGAVCMLRAPGGRHGSPPPKDGCVRPSPGVYGCLCGSCAEVRGSTGLHGQRRRAPDGQTPRSEALFTVWQVQDSNLRRHTPTDLQNVGAHALTCWFTASPPNLGTISPRDHQPCWPSAPPQIAGEDKQSPARMGASLERFHTVTWCPALTRLAAMGCSI